MAEWRRRGVPEPQNVSFVKIDGWDATLYELEVGPGVTNTHIRAHLVQAGTWVDVHLSVTTRDTIEQNRGKLIAYLRAIRVREKP